jgi:hypothetical protein
MKFRSILFVCTLLGLALYFGTGSSPAPIMATDEDAMPAYKPPVYSGGGGAGGTVSVNSNVAVTMLPGSGGTGGARTPCHIKGPYSFGGGSFAGPSKIEPYETGDGNCYVDLVPGPGWKDGHVVDGNGNALPAPR